MAASSLDPVIAALVAARRQGVPADDAPLSQAVTDAADAYAVEAGVAHALGWFADGVARHWKSGGPSRAAVPLHSPLPPEGVWPSPASAQAWPFHRRGIEAEIALRLGSAVTAAQAASLDRADAAALVDAMAVSIEVVDSWWRQAFEAPALLRLADLQSHAALVLGDWQPSRPRDWLAQLCRVRIGTQAEAVFRGTHSCGDPAWGLADWLRHATRAGGTLPAGSVVTTGSWVGMLPAHAGDRVEVEFDGLGVASVQF